MPAAVHLDYWDVAGIEYVLATCSSTEGEYRRVLDEPELVRRMGIAPVGEFTHSRPGRLILDAALPADDRLGEVHKANSTPSSALSSR